MTLVRLQQIYATGSTPRRRRLHSFVDLTFSPKFIVCSKTCNVSNLRFKKAEFYDTTIRNKIEPYHVISFDQKSRMYPKQCQPTKRALSRKKKKSADCELITKVSQATITTRNYFCCGEGTPEIRSQEEKQTNTLVFHRYTHLARNRAAQWGNNQHIHKYTFTFSTRPPVRAHALTPLFAQRELNEATGRRGKREISFCANLFLLSSAGKTQIQISRDNA
jgi:hypothetical protein